MARRVKRGDPPPLTQPPGSQHAFLESTGFLLARVGAESRRRFAQALARWNLRPAHYGALMVVADLDGSSQQELGRSLGIDPRNLVGVVDVLEQRGLVERAQHPDDRRRHVVRLTISGRDFLSQLRQAGEELELQLLTDLDAAERSALHRLLLKLLPQVTDKTE